MSYVAVGHQPRHLETVLALGCAVDEQVSWPSCYIAGEVEHHDQWSWPEPFRRYAELLTRPSGLRDAVHCHLRHWRRILELVPEGGAGLVVSSGGSIEPVLVAARPGDNHAAWGGALHQLEGAILGWDGESFASIRFLPRPVVTTVGGIEAD